MHKRLFLLSVALVSSVLLSAQVNLNGVWTGHITQNSLFAIASNYKFSLFLETDGNQLTGQTEIRLWDKPEVYGTMRISGSREGDQLQFRELEITEQLLFGNAYWCLKLIKLSYSVVENREILSGNWYNNDCAGPGEIYLERMPSV